MILSTIGVLPSFPIKGIYYIGQYGTSGYATAAKGYLFDYFSKQIPITWDPLYFDNSTMEDDDLYNIIVKSLIYKPIKEYDFVILHSTPDLWPKFRTEKSSAIDGKFVIGYCTWETNKLPHDWVNHINNTVHEVWVPSKYNEISFRESGVTRLIRIVPHVFLPKSLYSKDRCHLKDSNKNILNDKYNFYTIGEFNFRKGIEDTIRIFCELFSSQDNVRLIIKTHYKDYSDLNKTKCQCYINSIVEKYKNPPEIVCLLENMTNNEILALHSIGDCYISLTKSEGFGLTIFDAFHYKKPIIVTGYGGHVDFLGMDYPGLINYEIGPVKNMESPNYNKEQLWAYPNEEHTKTLIRSIYDRRNI